MMVRSVLMLCWMRLRSRTHHTLITARRWNRLQRSKRWKTIRKLCIKVNAQMINIKIYMPYNQTNCIFRLVLSYAFFPSACSCYYTLTRIHIYCAVVCFSTIIKITSKFAFSCLYVFSAASFVFFHILKLHIFYDYFVRVQENYSAFFRSVFLTFCMHLMY